MSSRLRDFIIKIPEACGVPNAKAWGKMNELAFDHELANDGSAFAKREDVSVEDRLLPAFGFQVHPEVDQDSADFAFNLLVLTSLAHDGRTEEAAGLAAELAPIEQDFPKVNGLYTVKEALAGQWA